MSDLNPLRRVFFERRAELCGPFGDGREDLCHATDTHYTIYTLWP